MHVGVGILLSQTIKHSLAYQGSGMDFCLFIAYISGLSSDLHKP